MIRNNLLSNHYEITNLSRTDLDVLDFEQIKKYLSEIGLTTLPIVDTVERVQGITVDIVIFSVCTTDLNTLKSKKDFIFSPNRINVAISRARVKAIIFGKFPFLTNK